MANSFGLGFAWFPLFLGTFLVIGGSAASLFKLKLASVGEPFAPTNDFDPDAVVEKYLHERGPSEHVEPAMPARQVGRSLVGVPRRATVTGP